MDFVINPIWFYLIGILSTLKTIASICLMISILSVLFALINKIDSDKEMSNEETNVEVEGIELFATCFVFVFIISLFLFIFIPSEEAMYKMLLASYITQDNVDIVHEMIINDIDHVVNAIISR